MLNFSYHVHGGTNLCTRLVRTICTVLCENFPDLRYNVTGLIWLINSEVVDAKYWTHFGISCPEPHAAQWMCGSHTAHVWCLVFFPSLLASVPGEVVHVALPAHHRHAPGLSRVKGHLVWQCDCGRGTEVAECTQPVKPVRSEGDFCLVGQGYIMSYCAVASPRADKKDCIYIYTKPPETWLLNIKSLRKLWNQLLCDN